MIANFDLFADQQCQDCHEYFPISRMEAVVIGEMLVGFQCTRCRGTRVEPVEVQGDLL